ncbi:MAG: hypothetical protein AAFU34_17045 [Pseudomonadota bacterium]
MISSGFFCGLAHSGAAFNRTDDAFVPLVGSLTAANNFHDLIVHKGIEGKNWNVFQGASFDDCSRSSFFKYFVQWLNQTSEISSGNTSIIYLSGHGIFVSEKYVILSSDTNPSCIFETGIPLFSIYHLLRAQQQFNRDFVLVIDACCTDFTGVFSDRLPKNVSVFFSAGHDGLSYQSREGTVFLKDFSSVLSTYFPTSTDDAREVNLVEVLLDVTKSSRQKSFFFVSNAYKPVLDVSNALSRVVHKQSGLTVSIRVEFFSEKDEQRVMEDFAFVCTMAGLELGLDGVTYRKGKNDFIYQLPDTICVSSCLIFIRELSKRRSAKFVNQISMDWDDEVDEEGIKGYIEAWTNFLQSDIDEQILRCALFVGDGEEPDVYINSRFRLGGFSLTAQRKKTVLGKTEKVKVGVLNFPGPVLLKLKATFIALANLTAQTEGDAI